MEHTVDATNQSLGRLATQVVTLLRGKNLPSYQPHIFPDVKVTITNLNKARFTGTKMQSKKYHRYSGYPGGLYTRTLEEAWDRDPQQVFRMNVRGMLPDNKTRAKYMKNLLFK